MNELLWMKAAKEKLGEREITGAKHSLNILAWNKRLGAWWFNDEVPWCGSFVAICLVEAGIAIPKEWQRALEYTKMRNTLPKPAYGCVAVKKRKGGGHVCFVAGRDKATGKLVCLGGNQNNMVCYALYDEADFVFKWYGMHAYPNPERYQLPEFNGIKLANVTEH